MSDFARLQSRALEIMLAEEGQHEDPPASNDGPRIREYLRAALISLPAPWCMALVQWAYQRAADELEIKLPTISTLQRLGLEPGGGWVVTGSVHRFWAHTPAGWQTHVPAPGLIALHDAGRGLGHAGIVIGGAADFQVVTIEGNTDDAGSRTGGSVMRKTRPLVYWNVFIDITKGAPG